MIHEDNRGTLVKVYSGTPVFKECFYSISKKNVIRGMHLQKDTEKLIFLTSGKALDVIYNPIFDFVTVRMLTPDLSPVQVPIGSYHGFLALEDDTCMVYLQSEKYDPTSEHGIRYDSFGYDWKIENPILSERDKNL